jgi:hypothetical protein
MTVNEIDLVFRMINDRLDRIEKKLDTTIKFKWLLLGAFMAVTSVFGTSVFRLLAGE